MSQVEWMNDARCTEIGTDAFFPEPNASAARIIEVCRACPVQIPCLQYALTFTDGVEGIWGGTTPAQRRLILKQSA